MIETHGASFGVVREIFGSECYGAAASLTDCNQIIDLGGNAGVFTLFALCAAPRANIHVVEAQPQFVRIIEENLKRNGFSRRVTIENAIVGGCCNDWTKLLRQAHPSIHDFSIRDCLERVGNCDFLKCDVEGAEFAFLSGDLSWLRQVRQIALEYHGDWAAGTRLGEAIAAVGFEVRQAAHGSLGYVFARRR